MCYHGTFENQILHSYITTKFANDAFYLVLRLLKRIHTCSRTDLPLDFDSIAVINTAFVEANNIDKKDDSCLSKVREQWGRSDERAAELNLPGAKAMCQILSSMPPKYSSCLLPFPYVHSIEIKINEVVYSKVLLHGSSDGLRIHPASVDASYLASCSHS